MYIRRVTMLEDEDGNCHLRNLSMHRANSEEEALNLLFVVNGCIISYRIEINESFNLSISF